MNYREDTERPAGRRLFRPLPHPWQSCDCWRCEEVRDENQAVRAFMGWPQGSWAGGGNRY